MCVLDVRVAVVAVLARGMQEESALSAVKTLMLLMLLAHAQLHGSTAACTEWLGDPHGAEDQAIEWATAEELQVSADAAPVSTSQQAPVRVFPLTPADVPLVPDVMRSLSLDREPPC